ncbi:hypothetical protein Tco_0507178, partial [Tanacetum coccineum]
ISCAIDLEVTRPGPLFRCDPIWGCYSGGEDDDVKSDGGDDNNGISDEISGCQVDGDAALHRFMVAL